MRELAKEEYRKSSANGVDTIVLSDTRLQAINQVAPYYIKLYGGDMDDEKSSNLVNLLR